MRKQRKKKTTYRKYRPRKLLQKTLHNTLSNLDNNEYYGDNASRKATKSFRFHTGNVGNFIVEHPSNKNSMVFQACSDYKVDVAFILETGLDWRKMDSDSGLYQRKKACTLEHSKVVLAHNTTEPPSDKRQWGGCMGMAFNGLLPRTIATDSDPENLGRWASILTEGKGTHSTRYVAGYMPCKSTKGTKTVYVQHQEHFRRQKTDREPFQAMMEDFHRTLSAWCDAGENIVLGMDANGDVRNGPVALMLQSLGFQEQITSRHGHDPPPQPLTMRTSRASPLTASGQTSAMDNSDAAT
jgi:hypothetical protein